MAEQLSKEELCEALSLDYADRATRGGLSYESAYNHYLNRCSKRKFEDLAIQYKVQGLGQMKVTNNHRKIKEHWVTTSNDDCEDGVCKL